MGVFDKVMNYSAKSGVVQSDGVFDVSKPEGCFLAALHRVGYSMYVRNYKLKAEEQLSEEDFDKLSAGDQEGYENILSIDEAEYNSLSDSEKARYDCDIVFSELHDVLTTCGNQIINAIAGSGKALVNDEPVLTDTGFRCIDDLKVGDYVFSDDGWLYKVLGVFPQGKKDVYIVRFSNGAEIRCCSEHLWTVMIGGEIRTYSTSDLIAFKDCQIKLPRVKPVKFQRDGAEELCLIGYTQGFLYGSAVSGYHIGKYSMDTAFKEIADSYNDGEWSDDFLLGVELDKPLSSISLSWKIMQSPIEVRQAFWNGFIDGGSLSVVGDVYEFDMTGFDSLKTGLRFICESLGFICYENKYFVVDAGKDSNIEVVSIEKLNERADMTCITIDSASHLYLTKNFIPTHNTSALTFKIMHDLITGESLVQKQVPNGGVVSVANKVWVCTFLKSGAEELERTLSGWQRKLGYMDRSNQVTFSTLDAEFKRCLNAMGVETPIGDVYGCLTKAINSCIITRQGNSLNTEDYQIISGIVTYYRGRLDNSKYQHPSCSDYGLTPSILDLLVRQFANNRQASGVMDFEEIMELLYKYLYISPNKAVQDFVANRYNFIYIDEFQDTSQMAYAILKFYARGHLWLNTFGGDVKVESEGGTVPDGLYTAEETVGKLVVVGDPSQCLITGSPIRLPSGNSCAVEYLRVGDEISCCIGNGKLGVDEIVDITKRRVIQNIIRVTTKYGSICGTVDHKVFARRFVDHIDMCDNSDDGDEQEYSLYLLGEKKIVDCGEGRYYTFNRYDDAISFIKKKMKESESGVFAEHALFEHTGVLSDILSKNNYYNDNMIASILNCKWHLASLGDLSEGDLIGVVKPDGEICMADIKSIETFVYDGFVYDISTKNCHNYISDGIVNHNCIYSFRGSDAKILVDSVDEDFRPVLSRLSRNWRCPSKILNPIVPSIHVNKDSARQDILPSREGGEFYAYMFSGFKAMISQLKQDITRDIDEGMKVAILCRTNYDGVIPAFMLEADRNFNFSISSDKMTLNSPLPKSIIGMSSLFTERSTPAVERALKQLVPFRMQYLVKDVVSTLKSNALSIWQLDLNDLRYSCEPLYDYVKKVRSIIYVDGKIDKKREIEALQFTYHWLIANVYSGDSAYAESARAYIEAVLYLIDQNNYETVFEFLEDIEYLGDSLQGRIKKNKVSIQIATVHEYKGKECDSVYVWNDSEGAFPSSKCDIGNEEQLAEERRVHYIACTRAKKREHIYCLQNKIGMFVKEMDLKLVNPVVPKATLG